MSRRRELDTSNVYQHWRKGAIREFLAAATMPGRRVPFDEIPALRAAALEELQELHGPWDLKHIQQMQDPVEQFMVASVASRWAWRRRTPPEIQALVDERDRYVRVLYYQHGMKPLRIIDAIGAYHRSVADKPIRKRDSEELPRMDFDDALAGARQAHAEYTWRVGASPGARRIRDKVLIDLIDGVYGRQWSNAELARLSGMSTAAVAQTRNELTAA